MAKRETRMLWAWLKETYPEDVWATNVELGPLPIDQVELQGTRATARQMRSFRRRIDATHWTPQVYHLIEAKIRDPLPGLGGVIVYEALARRTPDLIGYTGQRFQKMLVVPFALDWVKEAAEELGIEIVEFWQEWMGEYFREIQGYFTASYRIARDERNELRRLFGLD